MCTTNEDHMIYGPWSIRCDRQKFLSFWVIFCSFSPLTTWKIKILKLKKTPGDIIILSMCTINYNHMMHGSWAMESDRIFCYFGPFFALLHPKNSKNQNFEKMKQVPRDIIILHKCTKNHDHMLYCSWDMNHDRCNCYFSFWAMFCPFTSLTAQKMKVSKKWKKYLEISSFYASVPKIMIIWYIVPEIWCVMDELLFFILGYFLPFYPKNLPKK